MASVRLMVFNDAGDLIESEDIIDRCSDVEAGIVWVRATNLARKNREALLAGIVPDDE